jgi:hypothetical protein
VSKPLPDQSLVQPEWRELPWCAGDKCKSYRYSHGKTSDEVGTCLPQNAPTRRFGLCYAQLRLDRAELVQLRSAK